MICGAEQSRYAQKEKREDEILNDHEFCDFHDLNPALFLEIHVDVAAEYYHEKR